MKTKWKKIWPIKWARNNLAAKKKIIRRDSAFYSKHISFAEVKRLGELKKTNTSEARLEAEKIWIGKTLGFMGVRYDANVIDVISRKFIEISSRAESRAKHNKNIIGDPEFQRLESEFVKILGGQERLGAFKYEYEKVKQTFERKASKLKANQQ